MGMIGGLAQTDENVEFLRPPPVVQMHRRRFDADC